jgi:hypothetical protein
LLAGLAAGLIGGIAAALALSWALSGDGTEVAALRGQVDRLQQALAGVEGQEGEVAQLVTRVQALESGSGSGAGEEVRGQIESLRAADADLQARLDALRSGRDRGAAGAQVSDLAARVDKLEAALADAERGAGTSAAVSQRVEGLEKELSGLAATVAQRQQAAAGDQGALSELTSRIGAVEAQLGQAEAAREEAERLAGRLGAVEQQIAGGQKQSTELTDKVVGLSSQISALSTRVDVLGETVDQLQTRLVSSEDRRTRAATLALIVAQLDAALDSGAPFGEVLSGLRALGVEDPTVSGAMRDLETAAASGVPSLPDLRNAFERSANDIVHAAQAPDGDGLLDQAAGNLMRLVTVRPVGADVEGDGAAARVARAEAALAGGDLAAAVKELEGLKGAAAEAAAPWLAQARARLQAQQALAALQDRGTSLLSEVR